MTAVELKAVFETAEQLIAVFVTAAELIAAVLYRIQQIAVLINGVLLPHLSMSSKPKLPFF